MSRSRPDTPEQAEFREHCRLWLQANRPPAPEFRLPQNAVEVMTREQLSYLQDWQNKCYRAGLVGADYPKEYGGGGGKGFQRVAAQELARASTPYMVNVIGLSMAGPTILEHGTEEQKRRYLPALLSGEEIWCQGFSEPNAGSDLANVQTFAERDGDNWIVNGHKVWISLARFATWMILLARTSREHKHGGLTYFIAPVAGADGVTVRPLIKMTGEDGFNEVLMEDVVIPDRQRVDEVGSGWKVAMTTLLYERGGAENAGTGGGETLDDRLQSLIALAKRMPRNGRPAWDDSVVRNEIAKLAIRVEGLRQTARRGRVDALIEDPMRIPLQAKLLASELMQDLAALAVDIEGASASLYVGDERAPDGGRWPLAYLNSYGFTIAAGSSEIQRNILGERVLGLPKSK